MIALNTQSNTTAPVSVRMKYNINTLMVDMKRENATIYRGRERELMIIYFKKYVSRTEPVRPYKEINCNS